MLGGGGAPTERRGGGGEEGGAVSEPAPSTATKVCTRCSAAKPLIAYPGRRSVCSECLEAAKARTAERKEAAVYSEALGQRITDALASGMTVAQVCEQASMPTPRQLRAWRRANPEFHAACEEAERLSAAAHLDKAKEVLVKLEAEELSAMDAKTLFDGHMRLASTLNPSRYGAHPDLSPPSKALVDFASAIQALIDALPARVALPAPEPLDAEAVPVVPGRTLQ
jgi:transposase-like protein